MLLYSAPRRFERTMADRACVVILVERRVLMLRQSYRGKDLWTFPGGSIEAGETPEQAAIREVKEEVCLDIELLRLLCRVPRVTATGIYYCYLGRVIGGEARLGHDPEMQLDVQELHEIRWFPLDELREHPEVERIWDALAPFIT